MTMNASRWLTTAALIAATGALCGASAAATSRAAGPDPDCAAACDEACSESCCASACEGERQVSGGLLEISPVLRPVLGPALGMAGGDDDARVVRMVMTKSNGDDTVTVKIHNGEVRAFVNDDEVTADRIQRKDGEVLVLGEDGEVVARFVLGGPGEFMTGDHGFMTLHGLGRDGAIAIAPRGSGVYRMTGDHGALLELAPLARLMPHGDDDEDDDDEEEGREAMTPPPVMVGISMAEPSEGLRAHFELEEGEAILVIGVAEGLPAADAGVKVNDVIIAINGESPANPSELYDELSEMSAGDTLELTLLRKGKERTVEIVVEAYDASRLATMPRAVEEDEGFALAPVAPVAPSAPDAPQVFRWRTPEGLPAIGQFQVEIDRGEMDAARRKLEAEIQELAAQALRNRGDADRYAQMAEELARRFADEAVRNAPRFVVPQVQPGQGQQFGGAAQQDRLSRLEERLERLEASLDRLIEQLEKAERVRSGGR